MKLNKENFLKTEFSSELHMTIKALDFYLCERRKLGINAEYATVEKDISLLFAQ